jgi:hypothetical protein
MGSQFLELGKYRRSGLGRVGAVLGFATKPRDLDRCASAGLPGGSPLMGVVQEVVVVASLLVQAVELSVSDMARA